MNAAATRQRHFNHFHFNKTYRPASLYLYHRPRNTFEPTSSAQLEALWNLVATIQGINNIDLNQEQFGTPSSSTSLTSTRTANQSGRAAPKKADLLQQACGPTRHRRLPHHLHFPPGHFQQTSTSNSMLLDHPTQSQIKQLRQKIRRSPPPGRQLCPLLARGTRPIWSQPDDVEGTRALRSNPRDYNIEEGPQAFNALKLQQWALMKRWRPRDFQLPAPQRCNHALNVQQPQQINLIPATSIFGRANICGSGREANSRLHF